MVNRRINDRDKSSKPGYDMAVKVVKVSATRMIILFSLITIHQLEVKRIVSDICWPLASQPLDR